MKNPQKNINTDPMIKFKVQRIIAISSFLIFVGKLLAYFLTNSVGILTDALESTVNVTTGVVSLYAIYISLKPKDDNHPFGHGKAEFLSASLEGFLITIAGIIIIFEAIKRLFLPTEIEQLDIGIYIVAFSGLLNYLLGVYSIRVGRKHNSIALISSGKHLQSDTYSSIGLVIGLVLLYFTKIGWLDSAIALIFGAIIIITGIKILKETSSNLMDEADFNTIEEFGRVITENRTVNWIDIHNFKLVKYGNSFHVNFDLVLPFYMNIAEAHKEGEDLRKLLENNFSEDIMLHIHTDECMKAYCKNCREANCVSRKEAFESPIKFDLECFTMEKDDLYQSF